MKDKEVKVEGIEASHTLGGSGEGHVQGRGKGRGCTFYSDTEQYTMGMWSWRNRHETCSDVFGRVVFSDFFSKERSEGRRSTRIGEEKHSNK